MREEWPGYCTLTRTPAHFFSSGLGLGASVRLMSMSDEDASLRSGVEHESDDVRVCPAADHGILNGDPARRRPLGSGRLQSASAAARTATACIVILLLLQNIASSGDGTRRAILEVVSPDVTRLALLIRDDGRGLGSIDLRC